MQGLVKAITEAMMNLYLTCGIETGSVAAINAQMGNILLIKQARKFIGMQVRVSLPTRKPMH
jgi:hypothetical protein